MEDNLISSYFINTDVNITENSDLRIPQIKAYESAYDHFITLKKDTHAIIVLPTGVGKTGLMGILPYKMSSGRVLIITPQLVIKDAVLDSLDPDYPGNFWQIRNVVPLKSNLPKVIEYDSKSISKYWYKQVLENANIVILNIHKLQSRLKSSLLNHVNEDFFDMVIIDEAHHSPAKTWLEATNYFSSAKVIKLTGTPYRTDKKAIVGDLTYKYKLSAAMAAGLVKSLENFKYIPDELFLTIDEDNSKKYTIDQLYALGLKDEVWVSRSVAYSMECSEKVVNESISVLEDKLKLNSNIPHKIIAVASSISHANQIKNLYDEKGYDCAIVHSDMEKDDIKQSLADIENHRVKVVINVAMLGEGYNHPYLSVAAIFKPFRNALPYAQFIGRILRIIPDDNATASDNIGQVITHNHLYLDELWEYYKNQIQESEIIANLSEQQDTLPKASIHGNEEGKVYDFSIGQAYEEGEGEIVRDTYLNTELIEKRNKKLKERKIKIEQLKKVLGISSEKAEALFYQASSDTSELKRPDVYFKRLNKAIDERIKTEIVPELLVRYKINMKSDSLKNCPLFNYRKFAWIKRKKHDNSALLAIYLINALNVKIGRKKNKWTLDDLKSANYKLNEIVEFVESVLSRYTQS